MSVLSSVRERSIGNLSPALHTWVLDSRATMSRLAHSSTLHGHAGCVNTLFYSPDGSVLVSGSDDQRVIFWDSERCTRISEIETGHSGNIFCAKLAPFPNHETLISCAADSEIRVFQNGNLTSVIGGHMDRVKKIAVHAAEPSLFWSVSEDGTCREWDLRGGFSTGNILLDFRIESGTFPFESFMELDAVDMHPHDPSLFAVSGRDGCVRVYDRRRLEVSSAVKRFCPSLYRASYAARTQGHVTGVCWSRDGRKVVGNYIDDFVYSFSMDATSTLEEYGTDADADSTFYRVYKGRRHSMTIKQVSILGATGGFVSSGSDCGRFFVWDLDTGDLVNCQKADSHIVNCIESHPNIVQVATSGIGKDVKLWSPGAEVSLSPETEEMVVRNASHRNPERSQILQVLWDMIMEANRDNDFLAELRSQSADDSESPQEDGDGSPSMQN
eukprot:ANDGO_02852.mRNA.1 WD repeat protein iqw1